MSYQRSLSLIKHQANGSIIDQRASDGYFNASQLCVVAGRMWHQYIRIEETGHFVRALEVKTRIPSDQLIQEVPDGAGVAIWVHPKVAVNLGQWLSAEFAVQVAEWVVDWFSGTGGIQSDTRLRELPYHIERYVINDEEIPPGYFSILQQAILSLIGPLHRTGYIVPEDWVPDISIGLTFCAWLRNEMGYDTDALPKYTHMYQDGRRVGAKLYPDELLAAFRKWFREVWLPEYGFQYFKKRSPAALPHLDRIPALMARKPAKKITSQNGLAK